MPRRRNVTPEKLSTRDYTRALLKVAATTYRAAPLAVIVQIVGAFITAILPLVITYFAAATTTALAEAYAGKPGAGDRAIEYVIITALAGIGMTAWQSTEQYLSQLMRFRVETAMTDRLYEHFLRLDFWRYDDKETVDLYDKARKFGQFFPYIFERLSGLVSATLAMVVGVGALVLVSPWIALVALGAIVPGLFVQFRLSRLQTQHWKDNIETRRTVSWIEWGMMRPERIAELRLYGLVRHLLNLRLTLREKDEKARIDFERSFTWKRLGADAIEAAAEVIALVWVTLQIIAHTQPIGQFLYIQQIFSRAVSGSRRVVSELNSLDEDIANLFDYQRFMELPESTSNGAQLEGAPQQIVVDDVCYRYTNAKKDVLKGVSLSIVRGEHVVIVGENGAGKSTLVKIIVGLYHPTKGRVLLDDRPLKELDIISWHKQLGVLSQEFIRYDFANAKDNIVYGDVSRPIDEVQLKKAIQTAEAEFLYDLPNGLGSYVDQWMEDAEGNKGQELSGGQWQRLALARNFYRDSPIIILDEPTSAIDALAESRIFKHLFDERDKTIITVSHRLSTVKRADKIYLLKDGEIVEQGSYEELLAREGEFYRMFESQIK
ncbi:ABC transporter ATP-binding protein/permease [Patescibacteria group bacterium]|nr:ABC transporter ATP-binding protein/permease [Patescibacteria group bacterium]